MEITKVDNIAVKGISVRTDNLSEMNPSTAKIGSMWERFFAEIAPSLSKQSKVIGLYTNYESDHTGAFDVVACTDILEAANVEKYDIQPGNYLVFRGSGQMPQVVIELWNQIWGYFESTDCEYKRAFTTDFELYKNDNEVEIYISVLGVM